MPDVAKKVLNIFKCNAIGYNCKKEVENEGDKDKNAWKENIIYYVFLEFISI